MSYDTLRSGFGAACLALCAALPLAGQRASTYPRLALGADVGGGSVRFDCGTCSRWGGAHATVLELVGGLDLTPWISVRLARGTGFGSSDPYHADVSWTTLAARLHPPQLHGFYVQGALGPTGGTLTRDLPCTGECIIGQILTFGLAGTPEDTVASVNDMVLEMSVGYELRLGRTFSLTAQQRWATGPAAASGFTVGFERSFGLPSAPPVVASR